MELLEGKSLGALIQAKPVPLSLEATLDVMAQVCDGLDYAHQRAIVHRDIKPANLFVTPSGTVKILDFGIARLGSLHMTAAGALIGTPDYMAPEQVRGDEVDRRTDLWAVGAVLYQLLAGAKPFEGKPLARLLTAIAQTPHVPLQQRAPAVPKSVSDLVDRLLAKPRDARPASAGLVRDELRAILGRESAAPAKARLAEDQFEETVFMAPSRPAPPGAPPSTPRTAPAAPTVAMPAPAAPTVAMPQPAAPTVAMPPPPPEPTVAMPPPMPAATSLDVPKTVDIVPPAGHMSPTQVGAPSREVDVTIAMPPEAPKPQPPGPPPVPVRTTPKPAPATPAPPASKPVVAAPAARPAVAAPSPAAVPPPPRPAVSTPPPVPAASARPAPAPSVARPVKGGPSVAVVVAAVAIVAFLGLVAVFGVGWWYLRGYIQGDAGGAQTSPAAEATQAPQKPAEATQPAAQAPAQANPPAEAPAEAQPPAGAEQPVTQPGATAPSGQPSAAGPETPPAVSGGAPVPPAPARPPTTVPATPPEAAGARGAKPSSPGTPSGLRRGGVPLETGVTPAPQARPRPGVSQDTLDTLAGRQGGQPYDNSQAPSTIAAVNRVNYVLEQYVQALVHGDTAAMHEVRPAMSSSEANLMRARLLRVRLDQVRVDVRGPDAVARCRRTVEGISATGASIHDEGSAVFILTRRPTGWIITDVR
jgi:hypothetical protein